LQERIVLKGHLELFFNNYKNTIDEHAIKSKYIWSCDETMLDGENGGHQAIKIEQQMSEHITLLLFSSANGESMKPLVILPLITLPELAQSVYEDFNISGQPNGWIDGKIFKNYIQNFFVAHIQQMRENHGEINEPALLIMDHHSSRDALDAELLWREHHILLLLIPAHSSHIVQPLDLSTNGEFKSKLRERFVYIQGENAPTRRNRLLQITDRVLSRVNNKDTY
jgi:hypothetical protein